jgi:hypothetical protein
MNLYSTSIVGTLSVQIHPSYIASTSIVLVFPFSHVINFLNLPQPLFTEKNTFIVIVSLTIPVEGESTMYMYPNSFEIQLSIFSSPLQEDISVVTKIEVKKSSF